ncbi:leucine-rich repeat domain-containing protein [Xylophilus ampelinus]|uniref:Leucine-rich repeat (LRR) protein n=1 Tax=Xylophilus ampelinus TaxID=54067 RepID=A0A318SGN5_9BURK|nr:leucine-rich repeat domain-containing protein [Xylophilus ampelinus]MCS4510849.1 leucine-rich repeat domain-containing protein [Xylophilus ampelinus]PYE76170.1 Leucine-rich repeat (LRR) protein [Xylophilus ampelinus]
MGQNISALREILETPHMYQPDAQMIEHIANANRPRRAASPDGLRPRERPAPDMPKASPRARAEPDSLHMVGFVRGRKPSRSHEDPARRLQQWVEGGIATEMRQEALDRIKQALMQRSPLVDLSGLGLYSLPPDIGKLTETRMLCVSDNELHRLPPEIGNLVNLRVLEAANNKLGFGSKTGGLPKEIGRLSSLEKLNLKGNELSVLPPSIGNLSKLREFNVSDNKLEHLPAEIANLGQLERFSACRNLLSQVPGAMGVMSQLRSLNLSNNQLWSLPDAWGRVPGQPISLSGTLRELNISDNQIQQLPQSFQIPQKRLTLFVANNPLEILPINYGGFTYAQKPFNDEPDQTLTNHNGTVKVFVKDTKVRQGLVEEGRLAAGRGIYALGPFVPAQERRPPKPMIQAYDADSLYSVEDYIEDHREEGGIENIAMVGKQAGLPMAIERVPADWAEQRVQAWAGEEAAAYAFRNRPAAPAPRPMDSLPQWDAALPSAFRTAPAAMAPQAASVAPQAALQQPFLELFFAQLQQLPPSLQGPIHAYMSSLTPEQLVTELLQIQNQNMPAIFGQASFFAPPGGVPLQPVPPVLPHAAAGFDHNGASSSMGANFDPNPAVPQWTDLPPWSQRPPMPENQGLLGKFKSFLGRGE